MKTDTHIGHPILAQHTDRLYPYICIRRYSRRIINEAYRITAVSDVH